MKRPHPSPEQRTQRLAVQATFASRVATTSDTAAVVDMVPADLPDQLAQLGQIAEIKERLDALEQEP